MSSSLMNRHIFRIALLLLALTFSLPVHVAAAGDWPSYSEWRSSCKKLPSNRSLRGSFPSKEILPLKTFVEFEHALDAFFNIVTNAPMGTSSNWVGEVPEKETFFNTQRAWFLKPPIPFQPFAQKFVLPDDATAVIQGDLHGDIQSLLLVLDQLNEKNILTGFKINDPKQYMFFTGDFTDRGAHGIEVLYTLLRLKISNPTQVHFSRGNHEDLQLAARYGFFTELQEKYGRTANVAKLLRAYDFLPVVIYVGTEHDYVQMNHGGMEPGFDPRELISSPGQTRFQLLGKLNQKVYNERHEGWLDGDASSVSIAKGNLHDFTPMAPTLPYVLGFMWNDFTVFADEPAFGYDPGRAFVYGRKSTLHVLKNGSTSKFKIHAVFRAHQHSGIINPMMRRLIASDGLFRHWQESDRAAQANAAPARLQQYVDISPKRKIPEGSVWTFNVSPDSVYGMGCDFDFVTYGILSVQPEFKDWEIEVSKIVSR